MKRAKCADRSDPLPRVATLFEARTALRLSERTFRELLRRGELKVVALSPRRRGVLVEELRRYLQSRQLGA